MSDKMGFERLGMLKEDVDDLMGKMGVDEAVSVVATHKTSAGDKRLARQYYSKHKSQIAKKGERKRAKPSWKKHQAILAKAPKGGLHKRRQFNSLVSSKENVMEDIYRLAESLGEDMGNDFDSLVESLNYIADLGELLTQNAINESFEDEEISDTYAIAEAAETILEGMEIFEDEEMTIEDQLAIEEAIDALIDDLELVFESQDLIEGNCKKKTLTDSDDEEDDSEDDEEDDSEDDDEEDPEDYTEDNDEENEEDLDEDNEEDDDVEISEDVIGELYNSLMEARGAKTKKAKPNLRARREKMAAKKKGGGSGFKKAKSKWAAAGQGPADSRKQTALRKDIKNKKAFLGYLAQVKKGNLAPGQQSQKTRGITSKGKNSGQSRSGSASKGAQKAKAIAKAMKNMGRK